MTEQDLIKFKELSMQDGRLNLQWFAEYVAEAEREACAKVAERFEPSEKTSYVTYASQAIRARGQV
jgi:hypothetical protein